MSSSGSESSFETVSSDEESSVNEEILKVVTEIEKTLESEQSSLFCDLSFFTLPDYLQFCYNPLDTSNPNINIPNDIEMERYKRKMRLETDGIETEIILFESTSSSPHSSKSSKELRLSTTHSATTEETDLTDLRTSDTSINTKTENISIIPDLTESTSNNAPQTNDTISDNTTTTSNRPLAGSTMPLLSAEDIANQPSEFRLELWFTVLA